MKSAIAFLLMTFSLALFAQGRGPAVVPAEAKATDALIEAVKSNNLKAAAKAIKKGADVNARLGNRQVPLVVRSSAYNKPEMLELLLENGADIDAFRFDHNNALMVAARNNYAEVTKVLIKYDANVADRSAFYRSVLEIAAFNNSLDVAKLLLQIPDMDNGERFFQCPLSAAAKEGHEEMVNLLLAQDGKKAPSQDCLQLAIKKAEKFQQTKMVKKLADLVICEK